MPTITSAEASLGPCCGCGTREGVVNIVMLPYKAPEPGKGWGCVLCGLPSDGAIAVYCNGCLGSDHRAEDSNADVCVGYPSEGRRVRLEDPEPHDHNPEVDHGW